MSTTRVEYEVRMRKGVQDMKLSVHRSEASANAKVERLTRQLGHTASFRVVLVLCVYDGPDLLRDP